MSERYAKDNRYIRISVCTLPDHTVLESVSITEVSLDEIGGHSLLAQALNLLRHVIAEKDEA